MATAACIAEVLSRVHHSVSSTVPLCSIDRCTAASACHHMQNRSNSGMGCLPLHPTHSDCGCPLKMQVFVKRTDKQPKRHLMQFEHAAAPAAPTAAATAAVSATSPAALSVTGDRAAAIDDAATAAAPQIDSLIVLVQNQADSGCCSTAGNSGSNGSSSTGSKRPAAPWVFSEQYRQMTVDFHHPDLLA
mgnify:CR=1 FL=1